MTNMTLCPCEPRSTRAFAPARIAAILLCALSACTAENVTETEDVAALSNPLTKWSGFNGYATKNVIYYGYRSTSPYYPYAAYTPNTIYAGRTYSDANENELDATWRTASNLVLIHGNDDYPTTFVQGRISVGIEDRGAGLTDYVYYNSGTPDAAAIIHLAKNNVGNGFSATHEFGHAIGFGHEEDRISFKTKCPDGSGRLNLPDNLDTATDRTTVMSHCGGSTLSLWDYIGAQQVYGARVTSVSPFATWQKSTSPGQGYVAIPTANFADFRTNKGYVPTDPEGWVWQTMVPGTRAIALLYNATTGDYVSASNVDTKISLAPALGYSYVSTAIGYAYTTNTLEDGSTATNLVALNTYKNANGSDWISTANTDLQTRLTSQGYSLVRTDGWIFKDRPYDLLSHQYTSSQGSFVQQTNVAVLSNKWKTLNTSAAWRRDSGHGRFGGAVLKQKVRGTVPLKSWVAPNGDRVSCGINCPTGTQWTLDGQTWSQDQTEGYVFSQYTTSYPLYRYKCWNGYHYTYLGGVSCGTQQAVEGYSLAISGGN
jgi:hypothetical protein